MKVSEGMPVSEPEKPARGGYRFIGWYIEGEIEPYDFSLPVNADIVLVAKWARIVSPPSTYTITFHANPPAGIEESAVNDMPATITDAVSGSYITIDDEPTLAGYDFIGWYTDPINQVDETLFDPNSEVITDDLDLYAGWVASRYTISFDLNLPDDLASDISISEPAAQTVNAGESLSSFTDPELPDTTIYLFDGWYDNENGEGAKLDLASFVPEKSQTLYAKWSVDNAPWNGTTAITMHIIEQADDEDDIIEIRTAEELAGLARIVNATEDDDSEFIESLPAGFDRTFSGKTIKIINDIDLNDKLWEPIGYDAWSFAAGSVEGIAEERTKITGVNVKSDATNKYYRAGVFGSIFSSDPITVKNLAVECTMDLTSVSGCHGAGAFGYLSAPLITIDNCELLDGSEIKIQANSAGGIVGQAAITDNGIIEGTGLKGGIIEFSNCIVGESTISRTDDINAGGIGGIVGYANGGYDSSNTIRFLNCTSEATITSGNEGRMGYLAGAATTAPSIEIENCTDLSGKNYAQVGNRSV